METPPTGSRLKSAAKGNFAKINNRAILWSDLFSGKKSEIHPNLIQHLKSDVDEFR
jgi:hypothetical protein